MVQEDNMIGINTPTCKTFNICLSSSQTQLVALIYTK